MTALSKFKLAALGAFPPEAIDPKNPVDALMLAMALAYNDLKDAHWILTLLDDDRPDETAGPSPALGQWAGLHDHAGRMSTAIILEILNAIETADDGELLLDATFIRAQRSLNASTRRKWGELLSLSHSDPGTDPVKKFLVRVRNNVAYHYYDPKQLMKGYARYFFETDRTPLNSHAFLSLGSTMGETRFYFADAAAQQAAMLLADTTVKKGLQRYLLSVNEVLRLLLAAYFRLKSREHLQRRR